MRIPFEMKLNWKAVFLPKVQGVNESGLLYTLMAVVFCTCLMVANLTGAVLIPLTLPFLGERLISAGIITFPVTFLLTDLLNEFYGNAGAQRITWLGFIVAMAFYEVFRLLEMLPIAEYSPISATAFHQVAHNFTGMIVASLTAYLISQFLDIALFAQFKKWTGTRWIGVRATGSTVISQAFDSFIVTSLAFWGSLPWSEILLIGRSNYEVKLLVALGITPILYLLHTLIRRLKRW
ncbi:MAG: queuosine precursor transporter [Vampirovibrio sp.]